MSRTFKDNSYRDGNDVAFARRDTLTLVTKRKDKYAKLVQYSMGKYVRANYRHDVDASAKWSRLVNMAANRHSLYRS